MINIFNKPRWVATHKDGKWVPKRLSFLGALTDSLSTKHYTKESCEKSCQKRNVIDGLLKDLEDL